MAQPPSPTVIHSGALTCGKYVALGTFFPPGNFFPYLVILTGWSVWMVPNRMPDLLAGMPNPFPAIPAGLLSVIGHLPKLPNQPNHFANKNRHPTFPMFSTCALYPPLYYYLYLLLNRLGRLDRIDKGLVLLSFFAYPTSAQEDGEVRQRPKVLDLLAFLSL